MAGSLTETRTFGDGPRSADSYIDRIVLAWTSDSSGAATVTTYNVNGTLCLVEFNPSGTPTDLYDVTLTDTIGIDVLAGQGANLSGSAASAIIPGVPLKDGTTTSTAPRVVAETLTLNVTNAGNVKSGQVILYVR